ncbi:MAG: two-component regulator propeller domain-containing protein, partial [Ferruginibacter sp.]
MYRYLLGLVLYLLSFKTSIAQIPDADLANFTQQDGLPSNEAYCVFKDSKNFIWISTDQGVVRFNGIKMEKFELPDNVVFKIKEDAKGSVWFFSHTGKLAYFKNEKIYPYEYNDSIIKNIKNLLLADAYINSEDEIMLNSIIGPNYKILKNGTIIRLNEIAQEALMINIFKQRGKQLFTQINSFTPYSQIKNLIISRKDNRELTYMIPIKLQKGYGHSGSVYGSNGSIYTFYANHLYKLNIDGSYDLKEIPSAVLSIYRDPLSGRLFMGLIKGGVYIVDSSLHEIFNNGLNGKTVTSICSDSEGDLWFTTLENGAYYTNTGSTVKKYFHRLTETETQRLYNYRDTILITGNSNMLQQIDGRKILTLFEYKDTEIGDIFISKAGTVFAVAHFNFKDQFKTTRSSHPLFKKIYTIAAGHETLDVDGNLRLINISNGLVRIDLAKMMQKGPGSKNYSLGYVTNNHVIHCMFRKDPDNIFLGSIKNLYLFTISKESIRPYKQTKSVFNNGVTCMRQMSNGIYTIGIRFGGIALMKDSTVIARITEADGLLSNSVKYLLPVGNRLWIATPKGISVITFSSFSPLIYVIKNFGENAGMNDQIIYQLITFKGNILAATSKGIYEITNIEKLLSEKPLPIPLYISSVKYFKGDTSGISSISVPYNKSRVTVDFNAICFNSPKEMKYFYRLTNKDTT